MLRALAELDFPLVITTNYDNLFENALAAAGKQPRAGGDGADDVVHEDRHRRARRGRRGGRHRRHAGRGGGGWRAVPVGGRGRRAGAARDGEQEAYGCRKTAGSGAASIHHEGL